MHIHTYVRYMKCSMKINGRRCASLSPRFVSLKLCVSSFENERQRISADRRRFLINFYLLTFVGFFFLFFLFFNHCEKKAEKRGCYSVQRNSRFIKFHFFSRNQSPWEAVSLTFRTRTYHPSRYEEMTNI